MIDERRYRDAMSLFPSGVTIVAADDGQRAHGLTVASVASVSLAPPMVLACIKFDSLVLPILRTARSFSISMLAGDQASVAELFAWGEPADRQAALIRQPGRPPRIEGCVARLELRLVAEHTAGDHQVLIGEVLAIEAPSRDAAPTPLTWWRGVLSDGLAALVSARR